jgi:hypothetical protein
MKYQRAEYGYRAEGEFIYYIANDPKGHGTKSNPWVATVFKKIEIDGANYAHGIVEVEVFPKMAYAKGYVEAYEQNVDADTRHYFNRSTRAVSAAFDRN